MSEIAIKVENLYKEYKLGVISHGTLYRDMQSWWAKARGKEDPNSLISSRHGQEAEKDSFLTLKDVSFEIKEGERVGIIGKNGAGKSTLLKILSQITSPTKGTITVHGKIGSLLEIGTGFHTELTGRENIFLNGSILGMNSSEISRKLDEIIDFAGIEKHIDTPVKRYSSGMMVRLGFAVAAHLDTDILIADEVLAVGDVEFQKKALGKMQDLSVGEGRTVLFVSHNMAAVKQLCNKGIMLEQGILKYNYEIQKIIEKYILEQENLSQVPLSKIDNRIGNGSLRFTKIEFVDTNNNIRDTFKTGEEILIKVFFDYAAAFEKCVTSRIDIGINDLLNTRVSWLSTYIFTDKIDFEKKCICFRIKRLLLMEGTYNFNLYCDTNLGIADYILNISKLNIVFDDFWGTGRRTVSDVQGYCVTEFELE